MAELKRVSGRVHLDDVGSLHGFTAVAELKLDEPEPLAEEDDGLHVLTDVAELKVQGSDSRPDCDCCLHGFTAVAELKFAQVCEFVCSRAVSTIQTLDAHTAMSKQALDSETVRDGLRDVLLGPARLYEALREQASGDATANQEAV